MNEISYGYCHCGCGNKTRINTRSWAAKGMKRGEPAKYIQGHWHAKERTRPRLGVLDGKNVAFLPLTRGKETVVDVESLNLLPPVKWYFDSGYAMGTYNGKRVMLHHFILAPKDGLEPDHRNRNSLDNRRSNLRLATHTENVRNRSKHRNNTTGFTGVTVREGRYRARISENGRRVILGNFSSPEDAARAYDDAAVLIYGEFARTNFGDQK